MIINISPITTQNNKYFEKKDNVSNPNFGAVLPKCKTVPLTEAKALYGSLAAVVSASVAVFTKIYSDLSSKEPMKLSELQALSGIDKETLETLRDRGYLQREQNEYLYDITTEQNKAVIKDALGITATKSEIAKLLGVNIHTIENHITQGRLTYNENERIDLSNPDNLEFCETYKKGHKMKEAITKKSVAKFLDEKAKKYFTENGFIKVDKKNEIDLQDNATKEFLKKYRDKEIKLSDYIVYIKKFAQLSGRTPCSIRKSIRNKELVIAKDGTLDILNPVNAAYLKIYNKQNKTNPNLKTLKDIQIMLGYKHYLSVYYHVKYKDLVKEPNGMIDISKEPNKSYLEAVLKGEMKPISRKGSTTQRKQSAVKDSSDNSQYITQAALGAKLGITQSTIQWHIAQGHVALKNGKIDIKDPVNEYFIKNFTYGKKFVPIHVAVNPRKYLFVKKSPEKQTKIPVKNATETNKAGLSAIMGITQTPISKKVEAGLLIEKDKNLYSLLDKTNEDTMRYYVKQYSDKILTMNNDELEVARQNLKKYLKQYISRCHYTVADQFIANEKLFNSYVNYVTQKIANTDGLSNEQTAELNKIVKEIIYDKVMNENFYDTSYLIPEFKLENRCDLYANTLLLDRLSKMNK